MSTEQFIILLASVEAIAVFVLGFTKVSRGWKAILFIVFLGIVVCSTTLKLSHVKEKETKEATEEATIDQIDTRVRASLGFDGHIEAARIYRETGRMNEAMTEVRLALKKSATSLVANNLLAVLYAEKGEYDSAITLYTRIKKGVEDSSITVPKGVHIYHRNFAKAFMEKEMWREAKEELVKCLSSNPKDSLSYIYAATTLHELQEGEELYDVCQQGIAQFPGSARLHNFLGAACMARSRFDEAETALLKAVEVNSAFGQPYLLLGVVYGRKKDYERSAAFVKKALELDPSLGGDIEMLKQRGLLP